MKKIAYILTLVFLMHFNSFAQDGGARVKEKMVEYIQDHLGLSRAEAEKFQPIFLDYFNDLRKTNQDYRGDRLVLQQKVIELRLRYRDQFKPVLGDKRSNDVFLYERQFVDKAREVLEQRMDMRKDGRANKRNQDL